VDRLLDAPSGQADANGFPACRVIFIFCKAITALFDGDQEDWKRREVSISMHLVNKVKNRFERIVKYGINMSFQRHADWDPERVMISGTEFHIAHFDRTKWSAGLLPAHFPSVTFGFPRP